MFFFEKRTKNFCSLAYAILVFFFLLTRR